MLIKDLFLPKTLRSPIVLNAVNLATSDSATVNGGTSGALGTIGVLPVAKGGTGATTADAAQDALGTKYLTYSNVNAAGLVLMGASDVGKMYHIQTAAPANAVYISPEETFAMGTVLFFVNGASGPKSIYTASPKSLRSVNVNSTSVTIPSRGMVTLVKTETNIWIVGGALV